MNLTAAWCVFRKELLDVLRDRRTLIFMLVLPTLAIPAFMWVTAEVMTHFLQKMAQEQSEVLVINGDAAPSLVDELRLRSNPMGTAMRLASLLESKGLSRQEMAMVQNEGPKAFQRLLDKHGIDMAEIKEQIMGVVGEEDFEANPAAIMGRAFPPNLRLLNETEAGYGTPKDPKLKEQWLLDAVRTEVIAAAVEFPSDAKAKLASGDTACVTIHYLDSSDRSSMAYKSLKRLLGAMDKQITTQRLHDRLLPAGLAQPLKIKGERLPGPGILIKLMSQLLPYMILIFAFLGALYPAIDLGAGEKERGTLETLLVAPVSRLSLVLGKFGVILLAAVVSALLATVSLAASLQVGFLADLSLISGSEFSFSLLEVLITLAMILPVACIFSALLLALSIFAKSFKEGQSYAGPLQMIVIMPAFASLLPGVKLDWVMAAIPVVNVSLALKEIFTGNLDQHWGHVGLIFASTTVVAGLLLWFATWWFRREEVLFRT